MNTTKQYRNILNECKSIFSKKHLSYGSSWRIFRIPTFIDQIYIKANRIRNIEQGIIQKVDDNIEIEYKGIINYSILTLSQIELENNKEPKLEVSLNFIIKYYDKYSQKAFELMERKNHDYGEAWRNMYISSITDLILAKLLRIKKLLVKINNNSFDSIEDNLFDIINYSFFALIKIKENHDKKDTSLDK